MLKRFIYSVIGLFTCVCLSGCTVTANRIYTVCKYDASYTYCYNDTGEFFIHDEAGLIPVSSVGLKPLPVLHVVPAETEYSFKEVLPGLYNGTLESINGLLYDLIQQGATYNISKADWNNLELFITLDEEALRIIYNIRGDVRIYSSENSYNSKLLSYINER